jgi:hypothetical protein
MRNVLAAALLVATACATTAGKPTALAPSMSPGRTTLDRDKSGGFWIWADRDGWHLRTTTAGTQRLFSGVVSPIEGTIGDLKTVRGDPSQQVKLTGRGIEFQFATQADVDGFDWTVTSGCNRFDLLADGGRTPGVVRLGAAGDAPESIPFSRCQ